MSKPPRPQTDKDVLVARARHLLSMARQAVLEGLDSDAGAEAVHNLCAAAISSFDAARGHEPVGLGQSEVKRGDPDGS